MALHEGRTYALGFYFEEEQLKRGEAFTPARGREDARVNQHPYSPILLQALGGHRDWPRVPVSQQFVLSDGLFPRNGAPVLSIVSKGKEQTVNEDILS